MSPSGYHRPVSAETRAKLSAAIKASLKHATAVADPIYRAKISAANRSRRHSPETRAKLSAAQEARWADPEQRAKASAAMRRVWADPEHRARYTASRAEPEYRARRLGNRNAKDAPILGECVYCGAPAKTYDHTTPGRPEIVPACFSCNASKGHRTPDEWLAAGLYSGKEARLLGG